MTLHYPPATIEVFYHAVSVLSCRESSSAPAPSTPTTTTGHLPHPTINARRSLSADRIIDNVISSLSSPSSSDSIFIMPFVPYAVALSLSVVYLKMRHSKIPMYRFRAKQRFREIVGLLQNMGELYTSARVNAGLGLAILREMEKTAKELATGGGGGNGGGGGGASAPGSSSKTSSGSTSTPTRPDSESASSSAQHPSNVSAGDSHLREEQHPPASRPSHGSSQAPSIMTPAFTPREVATPASMGSSSTMQQQAAANHPQPAVNSIPAFTASWGDVSDIDLFVHFDPGFDLGAVDAALEANLDMGYPQLWTTPWPQ